MSPGAAVFFSQRLVGAKGVNAPEGIPVCKSSAMWWSGSWERTKSAWKSCKRKGWKGGIEVSCVSEGKELYWCSLSRNWIGMRLVCLFTFCWCTKDHSLTEGVV